jgi:lipopolysaccharide export system permease protein
MAQSFLAVLTVLAAISVTNTLTRFLARVAEGRISVDAVMALLALQSVPLFAVLIPLGLLLGILLAFGRLYRDSEVTAMMACGIGPRHFYRSIFLFGLPLVIGLAWFSLYGAPWALRLASEISLQAEQAAATVLTEPGQFREMAGGRAVAYSEAVDHQSGELQGVFIHTTDGLREVVWVAARGRQFVDTENGARYVQREDGERIDMPQDGLQVRRMRFERTRVLLDPGDPTTVVDSLEETPLGELLESADPRQLAELHWRMAPPIVALVLMLVAPPLSHSQPREGRYARVVVGVLYFVVYVNLLGLARIWLEAEAIAAVLGLWWVHAIMLVAALAFARGPYRPRLGGDFSSQPAGH